MQEHMQETAARRTWRPVALLVAILLTVVFATGGSRGSGAPSSSVLPVAATIPSQVSIEPAQQSRAALAPAAGPRPAQGGRNITAVGDSIMVDGMPNLRSIFPGMAIDAVAGRQVAAGLSVVQTLANLGRLEANIVVELGTNGTFTPAQLDRILSLAGGRRVVLLTNHCAYCSWVPSNNELMATLCTVERACSVADWEALANIHPEWFSRDGVHMPIGGTGGQAFAELISRSLGGPIPASHLDPLPARAGRAS
jgi:hypothetical protein